jgi:flavorubredoxin
MSGALSREVVSEIDIKNADGYTTALIVYQPGFSSFPKDASYAFAEGLASSGWRVEITTASSEAPSDLSKYSLLILAYPVYGGTPGTAIVSYVNRISDLNGIDTVIIACGGGDSGESIIPLKQQVQEANGVFYDGFAFSNSNSSSIQNAQQAGSNITP